MKRQDKAQIIDQLKDVAERASIAIVTDFKGLGVEDFTDLRAKLREVGVDCQVVKNTLARLAFEGTDHGILADKFKENCAIVTGYEDPVAAAKVVAEFAKESKTFEMRFASLEGKYLDEDGVKALSKLPSKDELLGKALGTLNAVPTNFVRVLANVPRGLLNVLTAVKDQKEAA
ncbi:50S ribosomal protein L10 [Maridesulfovibrio frigidus]|uniref:50S ribosomal protein L10 n=1 Tax=Maridesulfovibrio frigidus TaxID=340956 RepID=UPI0004E0C086|nr:50S ribosomal protein L10 [Maridesulfovibrio frigidus]